MTISTAPLRLLTAALAGAMTLSLLAACTPEPEPNPTKTALFASEEEAFAAAEETYREYTEAVNAVDLSDPESFESVYAWLGGSALPAEQESLSLYYAEQLERTGTTSFDTFSPVSVTDDTVVANLCVDVSEVDLVDSEGRSVLSPDRPSRAARKVTFTEAKTSTGLQIASNHKPDPGFTC